MTYKLFRVKEGILHFAEITVLTSVNQVDEVVEDLQAPDQDRAEVSRSEAPDWVDAALQGCYEALESSRLHGRQQGHCIRLLRVVGVCVDTSPEDVRIAAFMVAWADLLPDLQQPELTFENHRWHVREF